jgi:hypothetical protein
MHRGIGVVAIDREGNTVPVAIGALGNGRCEPGEKKARDDNKISQHLHPRGNVRRGRILPRA